MSQPGSTPYPFSDFQVRQVARVKLEYKNLLEQNKSRYEMLQWCEQGRLHDSIANAEKDIQLALKDDQINNRQLALVQMEGKYLLTDEQMRKEKGKKNLYFTTTLIAVATTIVLILKPD